MFLLHFRLVGRNINEAIVKFSEFIEFIASMTEDDMTKAINAESNLQAIHYASRVLLAQCMKKKATSSSALKH